MLCPPPVFCPCHRPYRPPPTAAGCLSESACSNQGWMRQLGATPCTGSQAELRVRGPLAPARSPGPNAYVSSAAAPGPSLVPVTCARERRHLLVRGIACSQRRCAPRLGRLVARFLGGIGPAALANCVGISDTICRED